MKSNNNYAVTATPEILKAEKGMWRKMSPVEAAVFMTALAVNSTNHSFSMQNISDELDPLADIPDLDVKAPIPILLFLKTVFKNYPVEFAYMTNYLLTFAMLKKQDVLQPEDILPFDGQDWYMPTDAFLQHVTEFSKRQGIVLTNQTGWAAFFFAAIWSCDRDYYTRVIKETEVSVVAVSNYMKLMKIRCSKGFLIQPGGNVESTIAAIHDHPHKTYMEEHKRACDEGDCPHYCGAQGEVSDELPEGLPEELKDLINKLQKEGGTENKMQVFKVKKGEALPEGIPDEIKQAIQDALGKSGLAGGIAKQLSSGETKGIKRFNTDHLSRDEYQAMVDDCATRLAAITDELASIGCIASLAAFSARHPIGLNVCNYGTDNPSYEKIVMRLLDVFMQHEAQRCTPEQMKALDTAFSKACED